MKNEIFIHCAEAVSAYCEDYKAQKTTAEDRLAQLTAALSVATEQAEAAVQADDQSAWLAADKARMEASAGIKYTQERLAAIQARKTMPPADWTEIRDRIEAEQGKILLAFVEQLQQHFRGILADLEAMQASYDEGTEAARQLYAIGGEYIDGYSRIPEVMPNWRYCLDMDFMERAMEIDPKNPGALRTGDPLPRAVLTALKAIARQEQKEAAAHEAI